MARLHKQGPHLRPRLSLLTKQQNEAESEAPAKGTLHVRTAAALVRSTGRQGEGPAAGWSVTAHEVQENGTERLRLRASGAVPATSTHGTAAPPQAPTRHTHQATHQAAAAAALVYTRQVRRDTGSRVIITLSNSTTHRNLIERGETVKRGGPG